MTDTSKRGPGRARGPFARYQSLALALSILLAGIATVTALGYIHRHDKGPAAAWSIWPD